MRSTVTRRGLASLALSASVAVSVMSALSAVPANAWWDEDSYDNDIFGDVPGEPAPAPAPAPAPYPAAAVMNVVVAGNGTSDPTPSPPGVQVNTTVPGTIDTTNSTNTTNTTNSTNSTESSEWPPTWNSTVPIVNVNDTYHTNTSTVNNSTASPPLNTTDNAWNSTLPTFNDTIANGTAPAPAPFFVPIPAPEGSMPTPTSEPQDPEPCTGVVYDGYLHGCLVYLDVNGNGQRDAGESFGVSQNGTFSVEVGPYGNLTETGVFRMEPATTRGQVNPGSDTCHDISTLMPERLPLAAKAPGSCGPDAPPLVLSPLSTLATLIGEAQVESVFELPAGIVGTDILRSALDGDQAAIGVMRREIQVKNIVSMLSSAVTGNQNAYSRIARAAFKQLGEFLGGTDNAEPTGPTGPNASSGITSRRMLLQTPSGSSTFPLALLQGLYATVAADADIDVSDIAFLTSEQLGAVATSIAAFNDLSDSLAGTVQDIYRLVLLMEDRLLPAIQSLVLGTTTTEEFVQSNTLDKMIMSFQETSLPEGSVSDPLAAPTPTLPPSPPTTGGTAGSSSLALGLGLGLGLGIPAIAAIVLALAYYSKRRAGTGRWAAHRTGGRRSGSGSGFVPAVGVAGVAGRSSKPLMQSASPAAAHIAASPGIRGAPTPRSPLGNVV